MAFLLAAGGGAGLAALTSVAWFHRTTIDKGTGEFAALPEDLSLWDLRREAAIALVAVAALAFVLSLVRTAPWVVGAAGIAMIVVLGVSTVSLLGGGGPACCPQVRTETTALIPLAGAIVAAATVAAGGLWAAESE